MASRRGARLLSYASIQVGEREGRKEPREGRGKEKTKGQDRRAFFIALFLLTSPLDLSQTIDADVVVAGAGAVGLAVARALRLGIGTGTGKEKEKNRRRQPREVLVLEARPRHGAGVSSRSSEVVHAGIYYEPGSLKALTCVEGARRLWDYCAEKGIRARKLGKLVVAPSSSAAAAASASAPGSPFSEKLEALAANAASCGARGLELLSPARARELEPALGASGASGGALLSRESGIFDSHAFLDALAADVEGPPPSSSCGGGGGGGGVIVPRAALMGGDLSRSNRDGKLELLVRTAASGGGGGGNAGGSASRNVVGEETILVRANALVVAAGLGTARLLHGDIGGEREGLVTGLRGWPNPEALPPRSAFAYAKGNYFSLAGGGGGGGSGFSSSSISPSPSTLSPFSRLLYPLPDPRGGLGIHATLDLEGRTRFGPDVEWLGDLETRALNGEGNGESVVDEVFGPEPGDVDPSRAALFDTAIRSYYPDLPRGMLRPDYAGVRPKLLLPWRKGAKGGSGGGAEDEAPTTTKPSPPFSDFFVAGASSHGARGVAVVAGIESPGLTASLALADEIIGALLEEA